MSEKSRHDLGYFDIEGGGGGFPPPPPDSAEKRYMLGLQEQINAKEDALELAARTKRDADDRINRMNSEMNRLRLERSPSPVYIQREYSYPWNFKNMVDYLFPYPITNLSSVLREEVEREIIKDLALRHPREYIRDRVRDIIESHSEHPPARKKTSAPKSKKSRSKSKKKATKKPAKKVKK